MRGRNRLFSAALVIARRDYVATVWSRSFLLFLLTPLILVGFVAGFGAIGGRQDGVALRPVVAVITDPKDAAALRSANDALSERGSNLPEFRISPPRGNAEKQALALLTAPSRTASAVLVDWPERPRLVGPQRKIDDLMPDVRSLLEEVALARAIHKARIERPEVPIQSMVIDPAGGNTSAGRYTVARGAQTTLFMLTILLAGMLLSNLVEEKSNKVIEVLAAAVPVDSIFLGKLIAMLGVSLTGITIWGSLIGGTVIAMMAPGQPIPLPATGWPLFILFGVTYYVMNYMILGGLFLGIGSQASTVREVQTLSMPVTMAQLAIFALGSSVVSDLDGPLGLFAAIFPLSSPLTMLARAAQEESLLPHLLALVWQALWVALIIRFAARRFRIGVLKSGSPPREKRWFRKAGETVVEVVGSAIP